MTTELEQFTKTSWEQYNIDIDFTSKLPPSATTVISAVFTAHKFLWPNGSSTVDETVFTSTTATIIGTKIARVNVKGGLEGYAYELICRATLNDGAKVEHAVIMQVRDN